MSGLTHIAYAEAYPIKESHGGGYRGVAKNLLTGDIMRGERRETIIEARNDAKGFVFKFADGRNMVTGTYNTRTKELWKCNYFIRSDEVVNY